MTNRLIHEKSPYLLQHAHNPVDWYPWGEEALSRARVEDKPILLSIGYSACHWCHVMERESFEDERIARLMNESFVCIKVDREERPDLDSIYMDAVQAMTGQGGWPLNVFLTPDGRPFYGGTYFPPRDRRGLPGFDRLLQSVAVAYRDRRGDVERLADQLLNHIRERTAAIRANNALSDGILQEALSGLQRAFDWRNGGFGGAPKFPHASALTFLLRLHHRHGQPEALRMVELSLDRMARGGIYDQLGGGFHRYSVDAQWRVPHFEKMLYDNALLSRLYLEAFQATGDSFYRRIGEDTLAYVEREMTSPDGGFYSSQDADSEGEEGKFFVWADSEFDSILTAEEARIGKAYYGVSQGGNFEGRNVLQVAGSTAEIADSLGVSLESVESTVEVIRRKLFAVREKRSRPGCDDKVLTAWNGLMLSSFAYATWLFQSERYCQIAIRNAEFVLGNLWRNGRLLRSYRDGVGDVPGYLEDYAFYSSGLFALYQATFESRWLEAAIEIVSAMVNTFRDETRVGFYDTSLEHEPLVARPKSLVESAMPTGNSVACDVMLRLSALTGEAQPEQYAEEILQLTGESAMSYPLAFGQSLSALAFYLGPRWEVAIVGDQNAPDSKSLVDTLREGYRPNLLVALGPNEGIGASQRIALLANRPSLGGRATAYVCRGSVCLEPVVHPQQLAAQLSEISD